jgi:hypothetical protein
VVWVPGRERLYVLGYDELRAYSLKNWDTASPSLALEETWRIPLEDGHDLSLLSGDELLLSAHKGVCVFRIPTGQFVPVAPLKAVPDVKSVNFRQKAGNGIVYTKAEESWWTHHIYFMNPHKTLHIPDLRLYKTRVIYR